MKSRASIVAVLVALAVPGACSDSKAFASCDDARKAGKAPLHKGDEGYSKKLDRDGDGVACA